MWHARPRSTRATPTARCGDHVWTRSIAPTENRCGTPGHGAQERPQQHSSVTTCGPAQLHPLKMAERQIELGQRPTRSCVSPANTDRTAIRTSSTSHPDPGQESCISADGRNPEIGRHPLTQTTTTNAGKTSCNRRTDRHVQVELIGITRTNKCPMVDCKVREPRLNKGRINQTGKSATRNFHKSKVGQTRAHRMQSVNKTPQLPP